MKDVRLNVYRHLQHTKQIRHHLFRSTLASEEGGLRKVAPNQGRELDYPTLPLSEIANIHQSVKLLCNDKHNFFVWTIDKFLHKTEQIMADLGYQLHARFVWDKENGVAPAFTVRFAHEYLLWFYVKGNMIKPECRGKYTTVIREKSTYHSKKPEAAYLMLEDMFPESKKLELFARNLREGWDCWGNEESIKLGVD